MTIVDGQIATLRELKEALVRSGITKFNSIGEIQSFLRDFETEKDQLPSRIERELEVEIQHMQSALESHQQAYDELGTRVRNEIEQRLLELNAEITRASDRSNDSYLFRIFYLFKISSLSRRASRLVRNLEKIVKKKTISGGKTIAKLEVDLDNFIQNRDILTSQRFKKSLQDLKHTKEVVDGLYTLVAGAIGEASVVNTLRKLSDEYYLINDFSLKFDPPVYNRKEDDRIYSVQIDHLLVSKSGIFLLETKNWSKASVQNLDLRSPVHQVKRTSFALFVKLNSDLETKDLGLTRHHWGAKKIPIRNVIVMINERPREEFKYVKVLSLDDLVGYIQYFDQTFDEEEVKGIFEYLKSEM